MKKLWLVLALLLPPICAHADHILVLQTDFGVKDGAVASMKGVAVGVDPKLSIYDLSHENTPFDIWEGAYRLNQTARYWPTGTVFVSVIDPGVGTDRASIVLKTKTGHYFVSPDNGTLTLVAEELGIEQVRQIDETVNRLPGSEKSYTFHGRDVYAYTGARLAAGKITFEQIGPARPPQVITLAYEKARIEQGILVGTIPFLDFQYGNVWTNIGDDLFRQLKPVSGDRFRVTIFHGKNQVYQGEMPYAKTFGDVPEGSPLLYLNSLLNVSFAINVGSFVKMHNISSGADWSVRVEKLSPTR